MKRNEFILSGTPRGRGFYGGPVLASIYPAGVTAADVIAEMRRSAKVVPVAKRVPAPAPARPLPIAK